MKSISKDQFIYLLIPILLFFPSAIIFAADIYKYEDEKIIIYTDNPPDSSFKIHIRDLKKDKSLRTRFNIRGFADDPAKYESIISRCSTEYGIDKRLVKAVIQAESNYNPNAVSSKGAAGLMQLMPGTARSLKVSDSFNPSDNIRGGVKYLRFLLDTFKGDESLALAAYNSGLSNVARYKGIPPFSETRNYVSKVLNFKQTIQEN